MGLKSQKVISFVLALLRGILGIPSVDSPKHHHHDVEADPCTYEHSVHKSSVTVDEEERVAEAMCHTCGAGIRLSRGTSQKEIPTRADVD